MFKKIKAAALSAPIGFRTFVAILRLSRRKDSISNLDRAS